MLRPLTGILFLILICSINAYSQPRLGLSSGIAIDINNGGRFKQVPISMQLLLVKSKVGNLIVKSDLAIPLNGTSHENAYTSSAGLPPAIGVKKITRNPWFTLSAGFRFFVHKHEDSHFFVDALLLGISDQEFKVTYKNYNDADYEIINPDIGFHKTGLVSSVGIGYTRKNFVAQLHCQTPLLYFPKWDDYNKSYKTNAPLQFTLGYILSFSKRKK
jgi:hypothetical protein